MVIIISDGVRTTAHTMRVLVKRSMNTLYLHERDVINQLQCIFLQFAGGVYDFSVDNFFS